MLRKNTGIAYLREKYSMVMVDKLIYTQVLIREIFGKLKYNIMCL